MKQQYIILKMFAIIIFMLPLIVNAQSINDSIRKNYTLKDYEDFKQKELRGEIPSGKGPVYSPTTQDGLVNNNIGASTTSNFTQSETSILAFGSNIVIGFNDAGSLIGGGNKFTGFSYSTDGGINFTDGGALPTNVGGDRGLPVLARNESTGRIYFSTLGFGITTIQVFISDDDGQTWSAPVNGTPGGSNEDKQWITVDNFDGSGNGNVYLISRNFGAGNGIYIYRSTDNGATFGPNGGVQIVSAGSGNKQGAFIVVGPDHALYAFWLDDATKSLKMRKSIDQGMTFGTPVTIANGLAGGVNGDLYLTGVRKGSYSYYYFRSNSFPHVAVNPVSGHLYATFNDYPNSNNKSEIYLVMSTDGGDNWSDRIQINDDGTSTDQWQPTIAVTPEGSYIGIFYYSRQDDITNNNLFTYNGRTGFISGSSIILNPSFVISNVESLPEFGRDVAVNSYYMSDYNSASATSTDFHVVWSDSRDNLSGSTIRKDPNVYYKSIAKPGLLSGPNIHIQPTNVDFGSVAFGQTGGPIKITIANLGDEDLNISAISSPDPDFSISSNTLPAVISSLDNITIDVFFSPLNLGDQHSSIDIESDALNNPLINVNIDGTGITNIDVSPLQVNFGDVRVGLTSNPMPITIKNLGNSDLTVSAINLPEGDFSLTYPDLPIIIPALGSTLINAFFSPLSRGQKTENIYIMSDAFDTPSVSVNLQGTGFDVPLNDLCSGAIPIDCNTVIAGTTILATPDLIGCGHTNTKEKGVWYTLAGTGYPITVSTCLGVDAGLDSEISVFKGSCESLTCVATGGDYCAQHAQASFASEVGTNYYILVYFNYSSTYGMGRFWLSTERNPPEIDVSPAELTFHIPINGNASEELTLSNIADPVAYGIDWQIISSEDVFSPLTASSTTNNQIKEKELSLYKVTNETIFALHSADIQIEVLHDLDKLRSQSPMVKEAFVKMLKQSIGEESTILYYDDIMENSKWSESEDEIVSNNSYNEVMFEEDFNLKTYGPMSIEESRGPDDFAYTWIDSDEPGGPVFSWVDISGTGTPITGIKRVTLPFWFSFYRGLYHNVNITPFGYIDFEGVTTYYTGHTRIPYFQSPNTMISPFWVDQLHYDVGGAIYYQSNSSQFIVQYTNVPYGYTGSTVTFQIILNVDGSILFQYLDMQGALDRATVGIENENAMIGTQIAYNETYIHNNLAVLISQLTSSCQWITSVAPAHARTFTNSNQQIIVNVDATGMEEGIYECHLTFFNNSVNNRRLDVPVTLILDETPPIITVSNQIILWPADHSYENLDLNELIVSVVDNVDGEIPISSVIIRSVSCDEPDNAPGNGDGNTVDDIIIASDCKSAALRKERQGNGNGRVYEVHVSVADASGNVGTATCLVTVPHDQNHLAFNDGPNHTVYSNCNYLSPITRIENTDSENYELFNYPNPFKGTTTIQFTLKNTNYTKLEVFNSLGIEIANLFDGVAESNQVYKVEFNGQDMPGGVYFYHLQSGNSINTMKKMMLIK